MKTGPIHLMVLLGLCLLSPLAAQSTRAAATTHHSVWKVNGQHSTVYLVGSVHVLKEENYPLPIEIEAAFTNSAIAAFETDIAGIEGTGTQMKLLAKAQLPEGETLAGQLSPKTYALYTNHLKEVGLPVEVFEQFKPSMAAIALTLVELQKLGFDPQFGLDKHFFGRAQKEGKQVVALETVDFQIALATDFSKEEGELLMKTTLEDMDKLKQEFPELLKAWQTGEADKLEKMLNEISEKAPRIFKRLVTDRNKQWVPQIEAWLQGNKNAVMIVGAGHLVGKEGVVELLRKKGLKVTQQ